MCVCVCVCHTQPNLDGPPITGLQNFLISICKIWRRLIGRWPAARSERDWEVPWGQSGRRRAISEPLQHGHSPHIGLWGNTTPYCGAFSTGPSGNNAQTRGKSTAVRSSVSLEWVYEFYCEVSCSFIGLNLMSDSTLTKDRISIHHCWGCTV